MNELLFILSKPKKIIIHKEWIDLGNMRSNQREWSVSHLSKERVIFFFSKSPSKEILCK